MAQVMVNFRMDEDVKRRMEQACKEMGLSMTTAFTIFATKVGKEKRIPFEITAEHSHPEFPGHSFSPASANTGAALPEFHADAIGLRREQLEYLCAEIRSALTAIHTAIPAAACGLSVERIRLLCADELKDKTAAAASAFRSALSDRHAEALKEKDPGLLDAYTDGLSSIAGELRSMEHTLVPTLRSWSDGTSAILDAYEKRLMAVSRAFDELPSVMQSFLHSTARRQGTAGAVQTRIRQAAALISDPGIRVSLDGLDALVHRCYDSLEPQTKSHLETYYLQTLELTLEELGKAEQAGEETGAKVSLCFRAISVLSQVLTAGSQTQRELSQRNLEAEVAALERLAAMRGDVPDSMTPP